jgi:general secretion pathway protein I
MRKARGFTLLEVVVALAIMAVGIVAVLSVFSGGLRNIRRMDLNHRAMSYAENVMNEILSDQSIREPRQFSGDLDEDFDYTATVDYYEEPRGRVSLDVVEPNAYMLSVVVDVHFKDDPTGRLYRVVCLKTLPKDQDMQGMPNPNDAVRRLFGGNP